MKRRPLTITAFILLILSSPAWAFPVYFKEQYYKLYHVHYEQDPDNVIENIYWLEQAYKADFANPLYAMATITNKKEWTKYRSLFNMHLNLKLIEQHLRLGSRYDKRVAYFYNAPWKKENLESLEIAEKWYRTALAFWPDARAQALDARRSPFLILDKVQNWEDEAYRIEKGELDYAKIIGKELARLERVRAEFQAMDPGTY